MTLHKPHFLSEILSVILVIIIANFFLFSLIRSNTQRMGTELGDKINYFAITNSKQKTITDDPCKWVIVGDPDAGNNYAKLEISCPNKKILNSLDLRAIDGANLETLLVEYSRIQGIEPLIFNDKQLTQWGNLKNDDSYKWQCFVANKLANKDTVIGKTNLVQCNFITKDLTWK